MIIEERQNLNVRNYILHTYCTFTVTCVFTNQNKGCFIRNKVYCTFVKKKKGKK